MPENQLTPSQKLLEFFKYDHLPPKLQTISAPFGEFAQWMEDVLPDGAEKAVALRKLLEAKDCAVRSTL